MVIKERSITEERRTTAIVVLAIGWVVFALNIYGSFANYSLGEVFSYIPILVLYLIFLPLSSLCKIRMILGRQGKAWINLASFISYVAFWLMVFSNLFPNPAQSTSAPGCLEFFCIIVIFFVWPAVDVNDYCHLVNRKRQAERGDHS